MILFNACFSKLNQLNQNQNKFIARTFVHLLRDIIVLSDIFHYQMKYTTSLLTEKYRKGHYNYSSLF